jgi:hypothetical protein
VALGHRAGFSHGDGHRLAAYGFGSLLVGWLADRSTLSSALNTLVWVSAGGLAGGNGVLLGPAARKNSLT